jgi:hypothetical protein
VAGVDALVADLAAAACAWQTRCCSPIELEAGGAFADQDACVAHAKLELQKAAASLRFGIAQSFITLDSAIAKTCVEEQKDLACAPSHYFRGGNPLSPLRWLEGCLGAFQGKVTAGGRCADPAECIAGTHCATVATVGPGPTMDGGAGPAAHIDTVCLANQKRGDACLVNGDCDTAAGDYCHAPDYRCAARVPAGGECDYVTQADPIVGVTTMPSPACEEGLICDQGTPRHCRKPPQKDEECSIIPFLQRDCDPNPSLNLICAGTTFNGVDGVCTPAGKMGEACGGSALAPCAGGLACNRGGERGLGVCGPPPKEGEPCSLDESCESPARCALFTGRCTKPGPKALGVPCTDSAECASLACSITGRGVCEITPTGPVVCSGANVNAGAVGSIRPPDGGVIFVDGGGFFDAPVFFDVRGEDVGPPSPFFDGGADGPPPPADANSGG